LIMRQAAIDNITGKDEKDIDRALASLFVAEASVVRCELLAQSLTLSGADGSKRIVQLFDMSLSMVTRRGVGAEREAEIKKRFTLALTATGTLKPSRGCCRILCWQKATS